MSILRQVQVKLTDRTLTKLLATFGVFSILQTSAMASGNGPQMFGQQLQPMTLTEIAFACLIVAAVVLTHRKIRD